MNRCIVALLATVLAGPVSAQEWQVARERFTYVGTDLTIDVEVESGGSLNVIRGEPGVIRVAGRAERGFTAAGLRDHDRLTLTAAGAGPVDYLVSVPEAVFVRVRLPGQVFGHAIGSWGSAHRFEWQAAERTPETPVAAFMPPPPLAPFASPSLYTTFAAERPPRLVALPDLSVIRTVTVRVEGQRFRVAASRPLAVDRGDPEHLVIRPAGPPLDLEIHLPASTTTFTLRAGGDTALTIDNGTINTLCTPLTRQQLSDGRQWFTFNPMEGRLECSTASAPRHGG